MTSSSQHSGSRRRVLVTGASIAGPAAAFWLDRAGFDVTVLERAPEPRQGGQNIDVRGVAREVLVRMGLEDAALAANTTEVGTRFVAEDGSTISEFPAGEDGAGDGPTAEMEILRGELSRILVEACGETVTWWSGDHVVEADEDDHGVTVGLHGGDRHRFDLVVVAEGPGSRTRDLVMRGDDAPELRRLGMYMAWATIPRTATDDAWWRWLSVTGARSVTLRPDNLGTTRTTLGFMSDPMGLDSMDVDDQKAELRARFGDLGWEVPRVLEAVEAGEELYVEDLTQVVSPTWSRGRVVLLGDAAWCATPVAGAGTSLALVGAYVLAGELSRLPEGEHPSTAFAAFEQWMRPMVEDAQDLPPGTPGLANPRSRLGVALFRAGTRLAASRPVRAAVDRFMGGPESERELPPPPGSDVGSRV